MSAFTSTALPRILLLTSDNANFLCASTLRQVAS